MPSSAGPAPRQTRILRGILLITLAARFFVVMNTGAEVPSAGTWAGAAIIIASGLHIVWQETSPSNRDVLGRGAERKAA